MGDTFEEKLFGTALQSTVTGGSFFLLQARMINKMVIMARIDRFTTGRLYFQNKVKFFYELFYKKSSLESELYTY